MEFLVSLVELFDTIVKVIGFIVLAYILILPYISENDIKTVNRYSTVIMVIVITLCLFIYVMKVLKLL